MLLLCLFRGTRAAPPTSHALVRLASGMLAKGLFCTSIIGTALPPAVASRSLVRNACHLHDGLVGALLPASEELEAESGANDVDVRAPRGGAFEVEAGALPVDGPPSFTRTCLAAAAWRPMQMVRLPRPRAVGA